MRRHSSLSFSQRAWQGQIGTPETGEVPKTAWEYAGDVLTEAKEQ